MRILTFLCMGLAVSLMAPAGAAALEAPDPPGSPTTTPQEDSAPVYVPLREVLPQLTEQTGIQFQVPESLQDDLIPWPNHEDVDNPPSMAWIRDYSHIDLVDEETGKRKIILLTSNSGRAPVEPAVTHARLKRTIPVLDKLKPILSKGKLRKLIKSSPRYSLPLELYEDEEYRAFFSTFEVHSPKDLKNRKKVTKIRTAARKLLLQMKDD